MTIDQALQLALDHHKAGRLAEAEGLYRHVLSVAPNHADSLHLLGVLASQLGQYPAAADLIRRAITVAPRMAAYQSNLGEVLSMLGQFDEAIACCRRALDLQPDFPEALNNLGNACNGKGFSDEAIVACQRAVELRPGLAAAHSNLGNAWLAKGQPGKAIQCYRQALQLQPRLADAHYNLGNALRKTGDLDAAIASYRQAIEIQPGNAEAHDNLGVAWHAKGQFPEAIACFRRALALQPHLAAAHYNLGNACRDVGQLDQAIACYRRALEIKPAYSPAGNNLASVLLAKGEVEQAITCYRQTLATVPEDADARNNLGSALATQGRPDEAIRCFQEVLQQNPGFTQVHNNLGYAWKEKGQLDQAIASYQRAMADDADSRAAHDNLLFILPFHPASDRRSLFEAAARWNQQYARPLRPLICPHPNAPDPERRLRVGYVSPDFHSHPVGRFILPLLRAHDRREFEVLCYSLNPRVDDLTGEIRSCADGWRSLVGVSDDAAAEMIRKDGIDILVDLAMHMGGNRLLVFARKPAPVQVTYLAYAGGTGVDAIDYRLTDRYLDPDESDDHLYLEKSFRLAGTYWCYQQSLPTPPVNELPALGNGHMTFGCLNNFCKINPGVLELWSQLLRSVSDSRLLLSSPEGNHRDQLRQFFMARGIDSNRLELVGRLSEQEYFQQYQKIDIALDPFPYSGGTTTCDALWMGVPVVTLAGRTAVGRSGVSILTTLGHPEWIAQTAEEYTRIAYSLASDLSALAERRRSLRPRMQASPLMDASRFARGIESAYRTMWQSWCSSPHRT